MSRSRMPLALGATAVGGIGYYLYQSGGNPKVAQKQVESDLHRASSKVKSEIPGRGKEFEKDAEKLGAEAGAKFDSAYNKTNRELSKAKEEAESYAKGAKADALKKVDEFDRKVEDGTSKAKSGISSWFGGK